MIEWLRGVPQIFHRRGSQSKIIVVSGTISVVEVAPTSVLLVILFSVVVTSKFLDLASRWTLSRSLW